MLYNRKSKLVTVTPTFGGEKFQIDARLSFRTDAAGNVKVVPHFIHREPKLDQEFEGYKFTKEDKDALRYTGNLGKVVELTGANGEKVPSYVSLDRLTNEIVSVPVKDVYIRDTVGQTKLTIPEVMQLKEGKALPPKEIEGKNGQKYTVVLQVSADRKGIEFVTRRRKEAGTLREKWSDTDTAAVLMAHKGRQDQANHKVGRCAAHTPAAGGIRQGGSRGDEEYGRQARSAMRRLSQIQSRQAATEHQSQRPEGQGRGGVQNSEGCQQ